MDWYSIGIAAVCGAIAAGIGTLVAGMVSAPGAKRAVQLVVTIGLFAGLFGYAKSNFLADHRKEGAIAAFEANIEGNPAFEAIEQYSPDTMAEIRSYLDRAVDESHDALTVENSTRLIISKTIAEKLPYSSDEAVINLIDLTTEQMRLLRARGGDGCFRFLFPEVAGGISAMGVFPDDVMQRDYESTRLILSTYDPSRRIPGENEAMTVLNPLYQELFDEYGVESVAQLANVALPGVDREEVCDISISLYASILDQPRPEALTALRWMLH